MHRETPKCVWLPFSRHSLYCSGLEQTLRQLWGLPVLTKCQDAETITVQEQTAGECPVSWNPPGQPCERYLLLYVADSKLLNQRLSLYFSIACLWFPFFTSSLPSSFRALALSTSPAEGTRYKFRRGKNHGAGAQLSLRSSLGQRLFQAVYSALSPEVSCTVQSTLPESGVPPSNGFWEKVFHSEEVGGS